MKLSYLIVLSNICFFNGFELLSQSESFFLYGGDKKDFGVSLIEKKNKEILVLGSTRSYGNGSSDCILLNLDSNLNLIKTVCYGDELADVPKSIVEVNNDNFLILTSYYKKVRGNFNYSLLKVDQSLKLTKRHIVDLPHAQIGFSLLPLKEESVAIYGMTVSKQDFYGQANFIKLNSSGDILINKEFGEKKVRDYGFSMQKSKDGFYLLLNTNCEFGMSAGFPGFQEPSDVKLISIDNFGDSIFEYTYNGNDFDYAYSFTAIDDHIYIAMNTKSGKAKSFDIKILKLDLEGELKDSIDFVAEGYQYVNKIISDRDSNLVFCGTSSSDFGSPNFYAVKFNQEGDVLWERKIITNESIYANDLIQRKNGNYLFTGKYSYNYNSSDIFLIELDINGNILNSFEKTKD